MQKLSAQASEQLTTLYSVPGVLARLVGQSDPRIEAANKLGDLGEIAAVPHFTPLLGGSDALDIAIFSALAKLLADPSSDELIELDAEVRNYLAWHPWSPQDNLKPAYVRGMKVDESTAHAVFGLLSWHTSGHVRAEAVRKLATLKGDKPVPYLLIRLNDWVAQVREVARRAIQHRLAAGEFGGFVKHLEIVFRLAERTRDDHSFVVQAVAQKLSSPDSSASLSSALHSPSPFIRRKAYTTAMSLPGPHRHPLISLALHHTDDAIRLWAVRDAVKEFSDPELQDLSRTLLNDHFMPVRRESLRALLARQPAEAPLALTAALLDRSQGLRDFARFYLRNLGLANFAEHYRAAIAAAECLPTAIAGLGETGSPSDLPILTPFLSHPRAQIRSAATRAIARLAQPEHANLLLSILRDDSKRVVSEAKNGLQRLINDVPLAALVETFRNDPRRHVRAASLALIGEHDTWPALPYLIAAAADTDEDIASRARLEILRMTNRVFTTPSPSQRQIIDHAVELHSASLPSHFHTHLSAWLASRR